LASITDNKNCTGLQKSPFSMQVVEPN